MRTVCDWRDLPAVPRRAVTGPSSPSANRSIHPDSRGPAAGKAGRRKRSRFSDLCDPSQNRETEVVPRKRPRTHTRDGAQPPDQRCSQALRVRSPSEPASRVEDSPSKSGAHVQERASKACVVSPGSDYNTTCDDTDGDASDGEVVRRVVRRKRTQVEATPVGSRLSRSASPVVGIAFDHVDTSPLKQTRKILQVQDTDDSSDEEAVLRVIRRQRSNFETTKEGKSVSPNLNSAPNASFENQHSSLSLSSTTPCNETENSSDEEVIRRVPRRRRNPVKKTSPENCVSHSSCPSNASPEDFDSNPVHCSGRTLRHKTNDSSDEETVLRGTRRRLRQKGTFGSCNDEEQARSSHLTLARGYHSCASSDCEGHSVSSLKSREKRSASSPSDERHAKRARTSTPTEGEVRKPEKGRRSSDLKSRSLSEEHLWQNSSCDPEPGPEMAPRKARTYRAQRRRCPRQSTARSINVPWYMLDEERIPYRLRSSSRNCAARCIFWTKTERRLFKVAKSPIHNRGLYALEDIPAFAPVIEYAGEVVTQVQSEIREWEYQSRHIDEVYMYQLQKGTTNVIDGTKRGGPAKFVNHSCEPNVVADEIQAGGTNRVWFFSLRPIRKHEEVLLDYCLSYEPGDIKRSCMCGARKCKKYLNYYGLTE